MVIQKRYDCSENVFDDGGQVVYGLLCDYERAVISYGACTLKDFLNDGWNIITKKSFESLEVGDKVYDHNGDEYKVVESPWESDDETRMTCAAKKVLDDGNLSDYEDYFDNGYLYFKPYYHEWKTWKKIKTKGKDKLCPILITKTNQPQN